MPNVLVNLPEGFFRTPAVQPILARLEQFGPVRKTSHNAPHEIAADLAWADAVLMWSWPGLDDALLDQAPKLQFAAHLDISQSAARVALRRGLPVSQGRAAFSPAVAEMALTLILSSLRRTSTFHRQMAEGGEPWVASFPDDIDPLERELTGMTVGVIGLGKIGQRLAELLAPFRCTLLVIDPFVPDSVIAKFGGERATLDVAAGRVDVLVVCAASNEGTRRLLGAAQIEALKPNALLVNVARAALVDTDALVERLRRGDLFAALDVFDQEPLPADHPLRSLTNAYLTPHRAGGIMASVERILNGLIDDMEAHFAGRPRLHALTEAMVPALDA